MKIENLLRSFSQYKFSLLPSTYIFLKMFYCAYCAVCTGFSQILIMKFNDFSGIFQESKSFFQGFYWGAQMVCQVSQLSTCPFSSIWSCKSPEYCLIYINIVWYCNWNPCAFPGLSQKSSNSRVFQGLKDEMCKLKGFKEFSRGCENPVSWVQ